MSEIDFLNKERELNLQLEKELEKWKKMEVHPMQAIGVDVILLDARFHALIDMLSEAGMIDKNEHHLRSLRGLLRVLSEWRSELEIQVEKAKKARLNRIYGQGGKKLH